MIFLLIIQTLSAIGLVGAVLMHSAKADGMAGIGGNANVYGNVQKEMEKGLDQITTILAVVFVTVSLFIAIAAK